MMSGRSSGGLCPPVSKISIFARLAAENTRTEHPHCVLVSQHLVVLGQQDQHVGSRILNGLHGSVGCHRVLGHLESHLPALAVVLALHHAHELLGIDHRIDQDGAPRAHMIGEIVGPEAAQGGAHDDQIPALEKAVVKLLQFGPIGRHVDVVVVEADDRMGRAEGPVEDLVGPVRHGRGESVEHQNDVLLELGRRLALPRIEGELQVAPVFDRLTGRGHAHGPHDHEAGQGSGPSPPNRPLEPKRGQHRMRLRQFKTACGSDRRGRRRRTPAPATGSEGR
jgi:hypothetical protein